MLIIVLTALLYCMVHFKVESQSEGTIYMEYTKEYTWYMCKYTWYTYNICASIHSIQGNIIMCKYTYTKECTCMCSMQSDISVQGNMQVYKRRKSTYNVYVAGSLNEHDVSDDKPVQ